MSAVIAGRSEDAQLLFDAAREFALILPPSAGSQDRAVGMFGQEFLHGLDSAFRIRQVVESKLEEAFSGQIFGASLRHQGVHIGQTEGDANRGKYRTLLRHLQPFSIS